MPAEGAGRLVASVPLESGKRCLKHGRDEFDTETN
jgi:hypothetical protein